MARASDGRARRWVLPRVPPLAVSTVCVGPRGRRRAACSLAVMPATLIADALSTKGLACEGVGEIL